MKNIINLIKFDIKAQKVQLIIEISIIVFLTIQLSIFWSKLPSVDIYSSSINDFNSKFYNANS